MHNYGDFDLDKLLDMLAEQTTTFTLLRSLRAPDEELEKCKREMKSIQEQIDQKRKEQH